MAPPRISLVIPVYRKIEAFRKNFLCNIPFLADCEIIIVNDDPDTPPTAFAFLPQETTVLHNIHNVGFAPTVNAGVRHAHGDYVLLLNTDVILTDHSWRRAINTLDSRLSLFAVCFGQKERDGAIVGRNELYFAHGLFHHRGLPTTQNPVSNAWAECGSALFRMKHWLALGGLDERYAPFYWEDVDLGYRARMKGWGIEYDPRIVVEHHHESTIGSFYTKKEILHVAKRNQELFTRIHSTWIQKSAYYLYRLLRFISRIKRSIIRT